MPHSDHARFRDRQGRVHARVSVDFPKEFGCYLASPLRAPDSSRVRSDPEPLSTPTILPRPSGMMICAKGIGPLYTRLLP